MNNFFYSTMLEFPRTEDKWTIKWDRECGIKMSLLQINKFEWNLCLISRIHESTHTHSQYCEYFEEAFEPANTTYWWSVCQRLKNHFNQLHVSDVFFLHFVFNFIFIIRWWYVCIHTLPRVLEWNANRNQIYDGQCSH